VSTWCDKVQYSIYGQSVEDKNLPLRDQDFTACTVAAVEVLERDKITAMRVCACVSL
jgi:hypothetical protein